MHTWLFQIPERGRVNWLVQCCVWIQVLISRAGRNCSAFPLNLLAPWEPSKATERVSWLVLDVFHCCQSVPFSQHACSFIFLSSTMSAGKPGPPEAQTPNKPGEVVFSPGAIVAKKLHAAFPEVRIVSTSFKATIFQS